MLRTAQNKACGPALPKTPSSYFLTPTGLIHSLLPIHLVGVFGAQVFGDGHVQMLIGQTGHAAAAGVRVSIPICIR